MRSLVITAALAAVLALAGAGSAMAPSKVKGTVGPGFTITLKNLQGQVVKTLTPGAHSFIVADKGDIHTFSLKGPGVNKTLTGVSFTGTKTVLIMLKKGTYTYYCSVHPTEMHHTFRVS
jgi:plastocyanin